MGFGAVVVALGSIFCTICGGLITLLMSVGVFFLSDIRVQLDRQGEKIEASLLQGQANGGGISRLQDEMRLRVADAEKEHQSMRDRDRTQDEAIKALADRLTSEREERLTGGRR